MWPISGPARKARTGSGEFCYRPHDGAIPASPQRTPQYLSDCSSDVEPAVIPMKKKDFTHISSGTEICSALVWVGNWTSKESFNLSVRERHMWDAT